MSDNLEELMYLIYEAPAGQYKQSLLEEAIRLADEEKDLYYQLEFRADLISNSVFHLDCMKAIVTFPRYLSIIDENADKVDEYYLYRMMWSFKYILNDSIGFHQISWEKIFDLAEEFKKRCIQNGNSLRFYYEMLTKYYMYMKDKDKAAKHFSEFINAERDELSDCRACELDFEVEYYLFMEDDDNAMITAKPLIEGERGCGEVPHITYPKLIFYYLKNHRLEEVEEIIERSYQLIHKNKSFLEYLDGFMIYFTLVDLVKARKLFAKHFPWVLDSRNELHNLKFYTASWMLWEKIKINGSRKQYVLTLPQNTPFYSETGRYNVEDIIEYCKSKANLIAKKFEARDEELFMIEYIEQVRNIVFSEQVINK